MCVLLPDRHEGKEGRNNTYVPYSVNGAMAASASFAQFLKASPPFTVRAGAGIILSNGGTRARVTQADILMSSPRPPSASCPLCKEEKRREGNVLSVKSLSLPSLEGGCDYDREMPARYASPAWLALITGTRSWRGRGRASPSASLTSKLEPGGGGR